MTVRRAALAALATAALAVGAVLLTGGSDPYRISVPLSNASGLRDGSAVKIAGIDRGKVRLRLTARDQVVADLEFDDGAGPVGRDARIAVVSANFLGLKRVEVEPGDVKGRPAPSGYTVRPDQVTTPTDLDQVLGVFDADTRTRAKVLLTEAGEAVVGRRVDIQHLLERFPIGLEDANQVLADLATDDRTMTGLVERSDRFVAQVSAERRALNSMIGTVGETAKTVTARRRALRETLARAPGTLRTLRGFLGDLEATTTDLGPAAREISAAAPALSATLAEVDGFRKAAVPTLDIATQVAPDVSKLAVRATPVLRHARPTARATADLATSLTPVSDILDHSADNVVAILENWSRAIQFRDQLGHVFRGEASFSPDLILTMVDRLTKSRKAKPKRHASRKPGRAPTGAPRAPDVAKDVVGKVPKLGELLDKLPGGQTVDEIAKGKQVGLLLDFLLGS